MAYPSFPPTLESLISLSPSGAGRVIADDGCRFRILAEDRVNQYDQHNNPNGIHKMLPDAGANVIGDIIHHVLERADPSSDRKFDHMKGDLNGPWMGAQQEWDSRVELWENKLAGEPINAHLGGLRRIDGYRKRRSIISRTAHWMRNGAGVPPQGGGGGQQAGAQAQGYRDRRLIGAEIKVWNRELDPTVRGSIDLIEEDGGDLHLIDWKTGKFRHGDEMSLEYRIQLQLYCALLLRKQADLGRALNFPSTARIENPENQVSILLNADQLSQIECENLLVTAENIFDEMANSVIQDPTSTVMNQDVDFTKPDLDGCKFCRVRPACEVYHEALKEWMLDVPGWENLQQEHEYQFPFEDVIGTFSERLPDGQGRESIILEDGDGRPWRISGIDSDAARFQNHLNGLVSGSEVAIFNVYHNRGTGQAGYIHGKVNQRTHMVYNGN